MANCCDYYMKVKGAESNVKEFIRAMSWEDEYKDCGAGRVEDCYIVEQEMDYDDVYYAVLSGYCAWSILSAMRVDSNNNNIEKLSERLNLAIEAYSSECGCEFQEHFCVINGEVLCDECIDYAEIDIEYLEEIDDSFWEHDWVVATGITKENVSEHVVDDYVHIGGYDAWDWEYI